jgi:hypothetical protein
MTLWNAVRAACGTDHPHAETALRRRGLALVAVGGAFALGACAPAGGSSDGGAHEAVLTDALPAAPAGDAGKPQVDVAPGGVPTLSADPQDPAVSRSCAEAVAPGYDEVAQVRDEAGVSSFRVRGRRWVLCDVAPGTSAPPAVIASGPRSGSRGFDEERLSVTATSVTSADGSSAVRFVAGGRLPWPVQEIAYRFPDGHIARARFVTSEGGDEATWWSMTYTATGGPLVDADVADPGPVTVSVVGDTAEAFRLPWQDVLRNEGQSSE